MEGPSSTVHNSMWLILKMNSASTLSSFTYFYFDVTSKGDSLMSLTTYIAPVTFMSYLDFSITDINNTDCFQSNK